jgi:hypothetical protein
MAGQKSVTDAVAFTFKNLETTLADSLVQIRQREEAESDETFEEVNRPGRVIRTDSCLHAQVAAAGQDPPDLVQRRVRGLKKV